MAHTQNRGLGALLPENILNLNVDISAFWPAEDNTLNSCSTRVCIAVDVEGDKSGFKTPQTLVASPLSYVNINS